MKRVQCLWYFNPRKLCTPLPHPGQDGHDGLWRAPGEGSRPRSGTRSCPGVLGETEQAGTTALGTPCSTRNTTSCPPSRARLPEERRGSCQGAPNPVCQAGSAEPGAQQRCPGSPNRPHGDVQREEKKATTQQAATHPGNRRTRAVGH